MRPATPGQPLGQLITAQWFNKLNQMMGQKTPFQPQTQPIVPDNIEPDFVLDESTGTSVTAHKPVVITGSLFTPENSTADIVKNSLIVKCKIPAALVDIDEVNWGVTTTPQTVGGPSGKVVVSGIVWALFEKSDPGHKYVELNTTTYTLKSTSSKTKARIISHTDFGSGVGYGMLLLSGGAAGDPGESSPFAAFTLTATLAGTIGATSANATVNTTNDPANPATITVTNLLPYRGYIGCKGIAVKLTIATVDYWYVLQINQHCLLYTAVLTTKTHNFSGTSPGAVSDQITIGYNTVEVRSPFPFDHMEGTPTLYNPYNFAGLVGDKVLVLHDENATDKDIIIDLFHAQSKLLWGRMLGDVGTGTITPTVSAKGWGPIGRSGEIPTSLTPVNDRLSLCMNSKTDHKFVAAYDYQVDEYVPIAAQHTARNCVGKINATLGSTPATFVAKSLQGLDGVAPSGTVTVTNLFDWTDVIVDEDVWIEWDNINNRWIPKQKDCG